MIIENELIKKLPAHLKQFIIDQNYLNYTAINQAVWRYVMKRSVDFLSKVAHQSYAEGLKKTGISIDEIPSMYGMNRILKDIGWAAVSVDGFIPPNAFMEFQAYKILVIASEIRQLKHIEYTPAPDIIHEAAGHAPIIANPEYAEYLRRFGEIGSKAISSTKDYELYKAVRHLSIIKEDPGSEAKEIERAEATIDRVQSDMGEPSEMAKIRNMHWWTVEYGLIGTLDNPKIYGAGLLSSIGESQRCLSKKVKKLPYDLDACSMEFDITNPQPHLYVTPDFPHLSFVLEEFANQMGLRKGGLLGIQKLIWSENLGTVEYNTGIQVSGIFTDVIKDQNNEVAYLQTKSETALSFNDKELIGHGIKDHPHGFGSPVGTLKNINIAIESMSPYDLDIYGIKEGEQSTLEFERGVKVEGKIITGRRNRYGKILMISFEDCLVTHSGKILFEPKFGLYNMAVGKAITSAFSGPADAGSFNQVTHVPDEKTHKINLSPSERELNDLYLGVRNIRSGKEPVSKLIEIWKAYKSNHAQDWLLPLEIYELSLIHKHLPIHEELSIHLKSLKQDKDKRRLINNGCEFLSNTLAMVR